MISIFMNQSIENTINGVSIDKLSGIMDAVKTNSDIAKFNFRAKGKWISGAHTQTVVKDFYGAGQTHTRKESFVLEKDEPSVLLGTDAGANPGEYALAALNGCLTSALIYHAAAKGIQIDEIETTLDGDVDLLGFLGIDERVRNGYKKINVAFKIKAYNATDEQLNELVLLAQKRSPIFDNLSNPTPIEVNLQRKL
jgi:uncharacterized OsmC-like protein